MVNSESILGFFSVLNDNDIKYALTKNINNELPYKLNDNKDIDIIVAPEDKRKFLRLMKKLSFHKYGHPQGKARGWIYLYQVDEFLYFYKEGLHIDVCFELCCRSVEPNTWLPLDQYINGKVWNSRIFNQEFGWWQLSPEIMFTYVIVRAVFDKHCFNDNYIMYIEENISLLESKEVRYMLQQEFFKFTDELIEHIKERKYDKVYNDYLSFSEY